MSATTTDFDALCLAIDAGDDSALIPLADLLEEAGDPRAAGLRRIPTASYPVQGNGRGGRQCSVPADAVSYNARGMDGIGGRRAYFACRHAAFLALSQALITE